MSYTLTTLKSAIQDYTENTETTFVSNLDLGYFFKKCSITPVDNIVSPIRFEDITSIFTRISFVLA